MFGRKNGCMDQMHQQDQDKQKAASGAEPAVPPVEGESERLRREAEEWKDKCLRNMAEFSNYRKYIERERQQQALNLSMDVLRRVLPLLDDLERALKSAPEERDLTSWLEGVGLIARKFQNVLREFQVVPIEALGKPFDPAHHSAITQEESTTYAAGAVMEELQKGYVLGGQVLRPTLVKVSLGPGPQQNVL
jgi:molecular chaperone GrpE